MPVDFEKRQHERQPFLCTAVLEFSSGNREARISDLSLGGCYVDSIAAVAEGEEIALMITRPSGESKRFTGTVAYVLPGLGFGIRFKDLTGAESGFLVQIIHQNK
jgi:PilZ domain